MEINPSADVKWYKGLADKSSEVTDGEKREKEELKGISREIR